MRECGACVYNFVLETGKFIVSTCTQKAIAAYAG
jgi:hypothetical protein